MYRFYVKRDGKVSGPYSVREISKLNIPDDVLVREENIDEWYPARFYNFRALVAADVSASASDAQPRGSVAASPDNRYYMNAKGELVFRTDDADDPPVPDAPVAASSGSRGSSSRVAKRVWGTLLVVLVGAYGGAFAAAAFGAPGWLSIPVVGVMYWIIKEIWKD